MYLFPNEDDAILFGYSENLGRIKQLLIFLPVIIYLFYVRFNKIFKGKNLIFLYVPIKLTLIFDKLITLIPNFE